MSDFDPARHGLQTHYNREARQIIQRLMLEDWKASESKLPTYMKGVARAIIPVGVSDDWLTKLSHQTMSKMLKGTSIPRYAFWACLHLYLRRKYGPIGLNRSAPTDHELLGNALIRFGGLTKSDGMTGCYRLDDETAICLSDTQDHNRVVMIKHVQSDEPFADSAYTVYEGIGVTQPDRLFAVLRRQTNWHLTALDQDKTDWPILTDDDLKDRLARVTGTV